MTSGFSKDLELAIRELTQGGLVAFPTETVYGLGADASNPKAVANIFALKGRPANHPLIVHISGSEQLSHWSTHVPDAAYRLAESFWPGPLTLILPDSKAPPEVTGGQTSVGVRAPSHPVAQALIRGFKGGIAAPSANRFGRISPTRASHVREEFGDRLPMILEGGNCEVGLESTILSLATPAPCLLRPGAISRSDLEDVLGVRIDGAEKAQGIRASGLLESHYAPRTALRLIQRQELPQAASSNSIRTALLCFRKFPAAHDVQQWVMPDNPSDFGNRLYATLRELDQGQFDLIMVETPPKDEAWAAIHDRLSRASHNTQTMASPFPETK